MLEKKVDLYIETHILTTPKPKLLLMCLEKILSLCNECIKLFASREYETSNEKLQQAQNILLELVSAMDDKMDEKISKNLKSLYLFSFRQLVLANLEKDAEKIEGTKKIINILYDGFKKSLEKENGTIKKEQEDTVSIQQQK